MPHHHSPVIFWLLVAATICVDVVALFWAAASKFRGASATLFLGLAYGQLSVLCVWAIVSHKTVGLRWIVPFVVGMAIGLFAAEAERPGNPNLWDNSIAFIGLFWVHVIGVIVALWALKPTRLLRDSEVNTDGGDWRFSIKNLIALMTVTAILVAFLGRNRLLRVEWDWVLLLALGNVVLLLLVIGIQRTGMHSLLRLAGGFAAALILGAAWRWSGVSIGGGLGVTVFYLIQAFVVWAWLELILFRSRPTYKPVDAPHPAEIAEQSAS
jgi:hypothetical protein